MCMISVIFSNKLRAFFFHRSGTKRTFISQRKCERTLKVQQISFIRRLSGVSQLKGQFYREHFGGVSVGGGTLKLTGGSRPAADIHVVLVVKFYADAFSIPSRDAAASTTAQRDGHHAVDVS